MAALKVITKEEFHKCFHLWQHCWTKCTAFRGAYCDDDDDDDDDSVSCKWKGVLAIK